jgi:putative transport protein
MIQAFIENPVLLLFFTLAVGYGIGRIAFGKFKLGVAAVLFLGLLLGGISGDLHVPEIMIFFGLSIFIYCIGLSSGPAFFDNVRQNGFRDIGLILLMLTITVTIAAGLHFAFGLNAQTTAGMYAGATTNTPALAGLIDLIGNSGLESSSVKTMSEEAVAGYSIAYPVGIAGSVMAIALTKKFLGINYEKEEESLRDKYPVKRNIINKSVEINNPEIIGKTIRDLKFNYQTKVVFGRIVRNGESRLSNWDTVLLEGDKAIIVGEANEIERIGNLLGSILEEDLSSDRREYITKRFFVSNPEVVGKQISELNITEHVSAVITRIQRGDIDLLAGSNTVLELGDMVRLVARRKDLKRISKAFGDSYESLGSVNLLTFGLGLALGLFLGMVTFSLPGGLDIKLGFAGGPIIVALILGSLRRTGPFVWTVPHGANQTFRQFGLAILLAGIGINSGHTFFETIGQTSSLYILTAGIAITFISAAVSLIVGYKLFKIPFSILVGMISHQPAILDYNLDRTNNKLPIIGFTLMMPVALIVKIIYVQMLFLFLN